MSPTSQDLLLRAYLSQWSWTTEHWPALRPDDKVWIQKHWELADGTSGPWSTTRGTDEWTWRDWWWLIPTGLGSVAWWVLCIVMGWY